MRRVLLLVVVSGILAGPLAAQSREEKVRNDKKKVEAAGYWMYNDFPGAVAEAKETGKPIVVVLRCLPCEECVKLDDDLIEADERIKALLEQYVRVRIVGTNGLDLSLFQFDTDQSFAVFFLNADGTIYGRFGTRSARKEWIGDVSIDGMAKALQGALALHKEYPKNKAALAGKRGPTPEFDRPEKLPSLAAKYKSTLNYEGNVVQSCIHCHQIGDAKRELNFSKNGKLPETLLFPFPHPKSLGLILDPKEMATVSKVALHSDAETAGFKEGDVIEKLNGQPLVSIADVQWVLEQTSPDGGEVNALVTRRGKSVNLTLKLAKGWRDRDDIGWRSSTWQLRRRALGGLFLIPLPEETRDKLKLPANSTALLVEHVGQYAPHNIAQQAGFVKGDIVVGVNSKTDLPRETDVISYVLRDKKPGDQLVLTILRDGKKKDLTFKIPG